MKQKIDTAIMIIGFSAVGAVYPAAIVAGIVWNYYPGGNAALVSLLVSWPIFFVVCGAILVTVSRYIDDMFGDDGEWVTVEDRSTGKKKAVKVYRNGRRDREAERYMNRQDSAG